MGSNNPLNPYAPPKTRGNGNPVVDNELPRTTAVRSKHEWTTVTAMGTTAQALEALRLLEGAKIECRVLQDGTSEASVAFHWVRSMPLGGHLVQVRAQHLAEAAAVLGVEVEPEDDHDPVNPADERMKKALMVALLGMFLCPGPAQLVSIALIFATPSALLTSVGRTRRRWALVVDLVVFAGIAFLVST
jgi:hypothetical protein